MIVKCIRFTDKPEELVLTCARNDYFDGNITEHTFAELMYDVQGEGFEDKKYRLLKKLMLRNHWGVFEHPSLTIHFKCSRACLAQITRHRHASFDVQSQRYVDFSDKLGISDEDFHWPEAFTSTETLTRHAGRKDLGDIKDVEERFTKIASHYNRCVQLYEELRKSNMPKEYARMVLPIGVKVNVTCSMNVRAALHVLTIRGAGDAQAEIQRVADGLREILEEHMPFTMKIWNRYNKQIQKGRLSP